MEYIKTFEKFNTKEKVDVRTTIKNLKKYQPNLKKQHIT